jgi:predicted DNA-binding transcriptional regulator YafY
MLLILQARGRRTAEQLAAELEVSVRTVYRDIESLSAAGVPVYGEPGRDGGYRLLAGYRTHLTGLTENEAHALFLTGLPSAAADLGLGATVGDAQLKLMAALPEQQRGVASRVTERFNLDALPWYREAEPTPHLAAAATAVWEQRLLNMRYLRWAEPHEVDKVVAPHGLVLKAGHWYMVAGGGPDRSAPPRTYRVSRLLDAQLLDETFERRPDFDLAQHWHDHLLSFAQRRYQGQAQLRVSPDGLDRLEQLLEPAVGRVARATAGDPDTTGWRSVTVPIESPAHAVPALLQLGADVEVTAPTELRELLLVTLAKIVERYK